MRISALRHLTQIAAKEFSDRFRSGWVVACVVVWLGAIGLTSMFGLAQIGRIGLQGYERTVISLLNLVQYLVPLLGLLLGHDLIVSEREERTLGPVLAGGVSRARFLFGKFLGGCATLGFPLVLGFAIAGTVIGLAARDGDVGSFLVLAGSGFGLGLVFLGMGLAISTFSRTRVQSLVVALLVWCGAVFVFDLVALGLVLATKAPMAAQEIEAVCDPAQMSASVADLHAAYEAPVAGSAERPAKLQNSPLVWVLVNPVDLFRAVNLAQITNLKIPAWITVFTAGCWLAATLGASLWKFRRLDL